MPDHVGMDTEIIAALFGPGIDPRELISKMGPDQSELHVNRPLTKKRKTSAKEKTQSGMKFFAGASGVVAGPAAIYTAAKSPALRNKAGKAFRADPKNAGPGLKGLHRLAKPTSKAGKFLRSPKTLAAGAGSAVGLQVLNMAGDGQVLNDETRTISSRFKKKKVSKKFVAQNMKAAAPMGQESMNAVNGMFAPLKNTGLQPLAQKPKPAVKPMGTLKPAAGLKKPKLAKPAVPATAGVAKPLQPISPVTKSDSSDVVWETEISKVDVDKHQVFGWATVTHVDGKEVVDLQDDYIPMEEIEKAAYSYVVGSRKGGDMHARDGDGPKHTADLIESVIFSPEKVEKMGLDPAAFPKMGWWLGMKVNDEEQWELVKKGERTGFSIHGRGTRVSKEI